jgi:DNA repair protein RadB
MQHNRPTDGVCLNASAHHLRTVSDPISTGCAPVDDLLGGGFERGAATQIFGPPAAGKTNLVLSAAVELAAAGGSTLYIDTEGMSIDRMEQIASAKPDAEVAEIADRIFISEVISFEEQKAAVQDASEFGDQVDLIVLDSATGFYRLERTNEDEGEALRDVARQITHLLSIARKHDVAVVFTNQVYTDPDSESTNALGGHTLDHWSAIIARLDRFRGGNRRIRLEKHHSKEAGGTAQFKIVGSGLAAGERR